MNSLYHIQVARAAFEEYLTPRGLDWVIRGNFNTDFYGSMGWMLLLKKVYPLYPAARHWYKAIDHLDQNADYATTVAGWNELRRRIDECADNALYPPAAVKKMFIALGRASHSLTDIYAHSVYVELLYDYYRSDAEAKQQVEQSGLPLHEFIGKHAPTFGEVVDNEDAHRRLLDNFIRPGMYTLIALPDEGPRSHSEQSKDRPASKGSMNPDYPEIFTPVMALATRDVCAVIKDFFEKLKAQNPEKYAALNTAFPGALNGPGAFERRAKWWSDRFNAWE